MFVIFVDWKSKMEAIAEHSFNIGLYGKIEK